MKKRSASLGLAIGTFVLAGGCAELQKAVVNSLPAEDVGKISRTCLALKPALDIAAGTTVPKSVSDVAVYPATYCNELVATQKLPATTDATTTEWLDKTIRAVGIAAKVAGVVIPLLL